MDAHLQEELSRRKNYVFRRCVDDLLEFCKEHKRLPNDGEVGAKTGTDMKDFLKNKRCQYVTRGDDFPERWAYLDEVFPEWRITNKAKGNLSLMKRCNFYLDRPRDLTVWNAADKGLISEKTAIWCIRYNLIYMSDYINKGYTDTISKKKARQLIMSMCLPDEKYEKIIGYVNLAEEAFGLSLIDEYLRNATSANMQTLLDFKDFYDKYITVTFDDKIRTRAKIAFGLEGEENRTLEEAGKLLGLTKTRVQQICEYIVTRVARFRNLAMFYTENDHFVRGTLRVLSGIPDVPLNELYPKGYYNGKMRKLMRALEDRYCFKTTRELVEYSILDRFKLLKKVCESIGVSLDTVLLDLGVTNNAFVIIGKESEYFGGVGNWSIEEVRKTVEEKAVKDE